MLGRPGTLTDVRQQYLSGSALSGAPHAGARAILPLSQSRREHPQGVGAALGTAGGRGVSQVIQSFGVGRRARVDPRVATLSRALAAPILNLVLAPRATSGRS